MAQDVPDPSWTFSACWYWPIDSEAFAGISWDSAHPGLILVMSSRHRNSPFAVSVVAGLALVVLRIVRHVSETTIREL